MPAKATGSEQVREIPLSKLHPFKNHPFKVKDDEAMMETADSIRQYGVLVPAIVRPREDGGYEMIAGHRRHRASELAEKDTMPAIVRNLDDDAATIIMVDSNLQREGLLPSERAFAYKMKLEAIKHQGARKDLTSRQLGEKSQTSIQTVAEQAGESQRQVQRFIRLTELIPPLLDMVDEKKIAFNPAYELSFLTPKEQAMLVETMDYEQAIAVPDEVAAIMLEYDRLEAAYRRRTYYHNAHYSLDRGDGIEYEALFLSMSPCEIYERKVTMEQLHAAIQISYFTGLRIGEACGLTWQDIDLKEQCLTVRCSMRYNSVRKKTEIGPTKRKKIRTVDFCDTLADILRAAKRNRCSIVSSMALSTSKTTTSRLKRRTVHIMRSTRCQGQKTRRRIITSYRLCAFVLKGLMKHRRLSALCVGQQRKRWMVLTTSISTS